MFPLDLIEDRLGEFSERAFRKTAADVDPGKSAGTDEEAEEQRLLRAAERNELSQEELEELERAGLVKRTGRRVQRTPLGKYATTEQSES